MFEFCGVKKTFTKCSFNNLLVHAVGFKLFILYSGVLLLWMLAQWFGSFSLFSATRVD